VRAAVLCAHTHKPVVLKTKPEVIAHQVVARVLEQDLLHALVTCLAGAGAHDAPGGKRRQWSIMVRFEDALVLHRETPLRIADLCSGCGSCAREPRRAGFILRWSSMKQRLQGS
jgi:hypothetical protein